MVVITLALALSATTALSTAPAGTQPITLEVRDKRHCLPEIEACFAVVADPERGEDAVQIAVTAIADPTDAKHEPLELRIGNEQTANLWSSALAIPWSGSDMRGWLVGVVVETSKPYSGGSGRASRLHLFPLVVGQTGGFGTEVASLPWQSELLIRACFSEDDVKRRLGVCHDSYETGSSLTLAEDQVGDEMPELVYRTQATAYPQTARRWEDSSAAAPLTQADLSHWTDFECTYQRTLRFNPATERYEMDRPAPECQAYSEP